jgi:hypothetical protein
MLKYQVSITTIPTKAKYNIFNQSKMQRQLTGFASSPSLPLDSSKQSTFSKFKGGVKSLFRRKNQQTFNNTGSNIAPGSTVVRRSTSSDEGDDKKDYSNNEKLRRLRHETEAASTLRPRTAREHAGHVPVARRMQSTPLLRQQAAHAPVLLELEPFPAFDFGFTPKEDNECTLPVAREARRRGLELDFEPIERMQAESEADDRVVREYKDVHEETGADSKPDFTATAEDKTKGIGKSTLTLDGTGKRVRHENPLMSNPV